MVVSVEDGAEVLVCMHVYVHVCLCVHDVYSVCMYMHACAHVYLYIKSMCVLVCISMCVSEREKNYWKKHCQEGSLCFLGFLYLKKFLLFIYI